MNEAQLKTALMQYLRGALKRYVIIRHEDRFTHGIPDISATGEGVTSWIEVKHANPRFKTKGIQELTMLRLSRAGLAFFVVYWEQDKHQKTFIVDPAHIGNPMVTWSNQVDGFSHQFVQSYLEELHHRYGVES